MIRTGFLRRRIALLLAVAIILAAGGVAVASNMGFKLNRILVIDPDANSVNNVGKNYVSIPFYNPYPTWADACAAWGLPPFRPSPLPARRGAVATKHIVNPQFPPQGADDQNLTAECGTAAASTFTLAPDPPRWAGGLQVRTPGPASGVTDSPSNIIIVGSHNPTLSLSCIPVGTPEEDDCHFAIPYHTTAANSQDVCAQVGLRNFVPPATAGGSVSRLDANTGVFQTWNCGSPTGSPFNLVLGEMLLLRVRPITAPAVNFVPAHF